jgi:hypothetical protein
MSGARAAVVRGGLVVTCALSVVLGAIMLIWPEGFFSWSWVNLGMDYNPHLLMDLGAMNLAIAVPLGGAAVAMTPLFVRCALASYAVWSVAHLLIHLRFRTHLAAHASSLDAHLLIATLSAGAVVWVTLLLLALGSGPRIGAGRGGGRCDTSGLAADG